MFESIALGGGGVRGFMMIGALQELERHQKLEFPKGLYGLSVGSILATALAYRIPIANIRALFQSVSLETIAPSVRLQHLLEAPSAKGLYSMDALGHALKEAFKQHGVDIETATIAQAPQPLRIIASNITRCTPTIFQGDVPILAAIKASCAIPGFFRPQVIYDSVYVDGGLYVPSLIEALPQHVQESGLIVNLSRPKRGLTPQDVQEVAPWTYLERLYQSSVEYRMKTTIRSNCVWLKNETVSTMAKLSTEEQNGLIESGASQLRAFWANPPPPATCVGALP